MEQDNTILGIIKLLFGKRKELLFGTLIVGVLIGLVLFFVPDRYKAKAIFYAASSDMAKPEYIFGTANRGMEFYGTGEDIDRVLTIANSDDLKLKLIRKANLFTHYDIDSTKKKAKSKAIKALSSNYSVTKTKYDAIEVEAEDTDPELAAELVNSALDNINSLGLKLIRESQEKMMRTFEMNISNREFHLKKLDDSLRYLKSKYQVYNAGTQMGNLINQAITTEAFLKKEETRLQKLKTIPGVNPDTIRYLTGQVAGLRSQFRSLKDDPNSDFNLKKLVDGMTNVDILDQQYILTKEHIAYDKERLKQLEATYNAPISSIHLIESASVPEEKSGPFRSLIVLAAMVGFFLLACLFIIAKDSFDKSSIRSWIE